MTCVDCSYTFRYDHSVDKICNCFLRDAVEWTLWRLERIYMVAQWASVTNLAKIFDIGRTKVTELVHQMEIDPEYKDNVISFSHRKKSVNIEAFQEFLVTKISRKWIK